MGRTNFDKTTEERNGHILINNHIKEAGVCPHLARLVNKVLLKEADPLTITLESVIEEVKQIKF